MLETARSIVQKEGIRGLWAATVRVGAVPDHTFEICVCLFLLVLDLRRAFSSQGATCLRVGLGAGIYFLLLDKATTAVRNYLSRLPILAAASSPSSALYPGSGPSGFASAVAALPKQQQQQGGLGGLSSLQNLAVGAGSRSVAAFLLTPVTVSQRAFYSLHH